jgi:hypothetical protein
MLWRARMHDRSSCRRIPEYEAKRYEGRIKEGGILLSVHCDNSEWTSKAKETLQQAGGDDIATNCEAHADWQRTLPGRVSLHGYLL